MIQYPLAIDKETGEIIHISDFETNKSKQFICLKCGTQMIAKALNSTKVVSHFAHLSLEECQHYETVLHDWAKNQFLYFIGKTIKLPSLLYSLLDTKQLNKLRIEIEKDYTIFRKNKEDEIRKNNIWINGWNFKNHFLDQDDKFDKELANKWMLEIIEKNLPFPKHLLKKEHNILIKSVDIEKKIENTNIIVDVLINNEFGVEIYVTHKIDKIKADKIHKSDIDIIEIDLSKEEKAFFNKTKLNDLLLNSSKNKKVFGHFEKIREIKIEIDTINKIKKELLREAKQLLIDEINSKKESINIKKNLIINEIDKEIENNPFKFFVDFSLLHNTKFNDYSYINEIKNDFKKHVITKFKQYNLPQVYMENNNSNFEIIRMIYCFDLKGYIESCEYIDKHNKLKVKVTASIFITDYNKKIEIPILLSKKKYESCIKDNNKIFFSKIKVGWYGIELLE